MKFYLIKQLKKMALHLRRYLKPEINNLKFLLGQSAIISSRAASSNFKDLWDAEVKVYSQWGEDGILDYICEAIGISKPNIIEIGSGDFTECNSRFLAESRNANVIAVDGRHDLIENVKSSSVFWKSQIIPLVDWVTPDKINSIILLGEEKFGKIDIFSIDLDGNDYWIIKEANLSKIGVVVLEYNPIFGAVKEVTVPRDDEFVRHRKHFTGLYYGASLKAYIKLLNNKDFIFIGTNRVGNNAFFVKNNLLHKFNIATPSNLEKYVDWRIRESREESGSLSYLSGKDRLEIIKELPLIELTTQSEVYVGSLIAT
jgi:hypothetical protein